MFSKDKNKIIYSEKYNNLKDNITPQLIKVSQETLDKLKKNKENIKGV